MKTINKKNEFKIEFNANRALRLAEGIASQPSTKAIIRDLAKS